MNEAYNLDRLHKLLITHFDENEIKQLCFTLHVDYDDLIAIEKNSLAREFILYLNRRGRLNELANEMVQQRPKVLSIGLIRNDNREKPKTSWNPPPIRDEAQNENDSQEGKSVTPWSNTLWITAVLGLIGSGLWVIQEPGYEPLLLFLTQITVLIAFWRINNDEHARRWDTLLAFLIIVTFAIVIFNAFNGTWGSSMSEISGAIIGLVGLFGGAILIAVGSGVWAFAPRMRLKMHPRIGSPNVPEVVIGIFLFLFGGASFLHSISDWQLFKGSDLLFRLLVIGLLGLALLLGYVRRIETLTIVKNPLNTGNTPRSIGLGLVVIAIGIAITATIQSFIGNGLPTPEPHVTIGADPTATSPQIAPSRSSAQFNQQIIRDGGTLDIAVPLVSGTYRGLPDNHKLWIVAQSGVTCYPMNGPVTLEPTGVWRHTGITFPRSGEAYLLTLVLADMETSDLLESAIGKQTGLPCQAGRQQVLETISVTVR